MSTLIKEAVVAADGVVKVAEAFGISRISIYEWIAKNRLPADRVIPLAEMTAWRFTPHMLDPSLYPHEEDGLPLSARAALASDDRRSARERRAYADRRSLERKATVKETS